MDNKKLKEAEEFYQKKIREWVFADLEKGMHAGANLLTLLGCFVFTETLGILLPQLSNEQGLGGEKDKRFYRCFFRLKSEVYLRKIDNQLKKFSNKNIYKHFRHSMAHGFLPAVKKVQNSQTFFAPVVVAKVGVKGNRKTPPIVFRSGKLTIMAVNYVNELKQAVDDFYQSIFIKKDKNFQKAVVRGIDTLLRGKP